MCYLACFLIAQIHGDASLTTVALLKIGIVPANRYALQSTFSPGGVTAGGILYFDNLSPHLSKIGGSTWVKSSTLIPSRGIRIYVFLLSTNIAVLAMRTSNTSVPLIGGASRFLN